jgi:hypothetical protein
MAENESKPADVDALAAMANGANLNEPDPYVEQQAEIEPEDDTPASSDLDQFAQRPNSLTSPGPRPPVSNPRLVDAPPPMSRAEAAKRLAAQTSAAYTSQLKKMLIPLMLAIGGLLVAIALLCFFGAGPQMDPETHEPTRYLFGEDFKYFSFICAPLGAILLVGAYWFHLESKRKK